MSFELKSCDNGCHCDFLCDEDFLGEWPLLITHSLNSLVYHSRGSQFVTFHFGHPSWVTRLVLLWCDMVTPIGKSLYTNKIDRFRLFILILSHTAAYLCQPRSAGKVYSPPSLHISLCNPGIFSGGIHLLWWPRMIVSWNHFTLY